MLGVLFGKNFFLSFFFFFKFAIAALPRFSHESIYLPGTEFVLDPV